MPLITVTEILDYLKNIADPGQLTGMAHFGMATEKRLGVNMPELRSLAKKIGKNLALALELWDTGFSEARILAGMVAEPGLFTGDQADAWVNDLDSWDVCDQLCMNLLEKVPFAEKKIHEWAGREEEFVKRAAFALMACLAWHDKKAPDTFFINLLQVIEQGVVDDRNYVKKAISWAMRNMGKRNLAMNAIVTEAAQRIGLMDSRSARWISADVLRELQDEKVLVRLQNSSGI